MVGREEFAAILVLVWLMASIGGLSFQMVRWAAVAGSTALYVTAGVMLFAAALYLFLVASEVPSILEAVLNENTPAPDWLSIVRTMALASFNTAVLVVLELLARFTRRLFDTVRRGEDW